MTYMPVAEKRTESGSSLQVWRSCPKRYSFQIEERLEPQGYSPSLAFGSLVHFHVGELNAGDSPGALQQSSERLSFLQELLERHPLLEQEIVTQDQLARSVAGLWAEHWRNDTGPMGTQALEFVDVEKEWRFELPSGFHVGKRDGLVRHKEYGKLFLYELKTAASRDEAGYMERLAVDLQINSNLIALQQEGHEVAGVIYDIIWKPAIRLKTGRKTMPDETPEEFNLRLLEEYRTGLSFQRVVIQRSPEHLQEYVSELEAQFWEIENQSVRYRNAGACNLYHKVCPYQEICVPGAPEELKKAFRVREKKLVELK